MRAVDIGSDTAVTRFDTQQIVEDGDRIAGFAALDAGFLLGSATVSGTFDSFFPVSGNINFNFGTFILNQDLILHNTSEIIHWGNIEGNGHVFELAQNMHCFPIEGELDICSITFTFDDVETVAVNSVHFSFDTQYIVEGIGANLAVDEVINENFLEEKDSVVLSTDVLSAKWHPSKDFIAVGTVAGGADEIFTYTFDRVGNTLTLIDSVNLGGVGNDANSVAWHPDGGHLAVASDAAANEIIVYEIDAAGNFGASTSVNITPNAEVVSWNDDGSFLAVGTALQGGFDELRIYSFSTAPLGLSLDASFNTAASINDLAWNKSATANGEIVVGLVGGANRLRLFRHNGAGSITELSTGITVATTVNSVDWHPDGGCIVAGLQNNVIGTGGEIRTYVFVDDGLIEEDDQEITDNVLSVAWSPNGRLLAVGDEGLGIEDPSVSLWRFDAAFLDTSEVTFDNVHLYLNSNTAWDFTSLHFTGESSIRGNNNIMSFGTTFTVTVDANASVLFSNIVLMGMNDQKLTLVDGTSTVSFAQAELALSGDYIFDKGHFELLNDFKITGEGHTFIYQSPVSSTILSSEDVEVVNVCQPVYRGKLILENGVTFSYDSSISNTLINLEDEHATIVLNSATLAATTSLQLTKGNLIIDGRSSFISADGIIYGNNSAVDNLHVEMRPAANLEVTGKLINQNV